MTGRYVPPEAHLRQLPSVFVDVDADAAAWIVSNTNVRAAFAARSRDADRAVVSVLLALFELAASGETDADVSSSALSSDVGSDCGTSVALACPAREESVLTVKAAADVIGIGERAVRKAIADKRLPAVAVGGTWTVTRQDAANYQRRTA